MRGGSVFDLLIYHLSKLSGRRSTDFPVGRNVLYGSMESRHSLKVNKALVRPMSA